MRHPPAIVVQLVHIHGPLKGEIMEFSEPRISIGRHPSCHVHFPTDLSTVSRKHAEIVREGNRFKLIDQSTNGTFVNGKRVEEAHLKDGDVLTFAEGGPKVSFLTRIMEGQPEIETEIAPPPTPLKEPEISPDERPPAATPAQPEPGRAEEIPVQKIQTPLVIQYGPTLHSFKELPVIIGKNPGCDFTLDHPAILDRHAQIFFGQERYWVKNLTGQKNLLINGEPVHLQSPLNPNDALDLSPQGPRFCFLGEGRLAEVERPAPEESLGPSNEKEEAPQQDGLAPRGPMGVICNKLKNLLRR